MLSSPELFIKGTSWLSAASVLGRRTTFILYSLRAAPRGGDLQAGMSSMVCVLESGAQPISYSRAYPLASAAYSFPWEKVIHCFLTRLTLSTLVALCGYAVGFSCSIARWQLSFHFKKAEVKGIVLILLQLQEFFIVKLKERSFLANHFLFLAIDIFIFFLCLLAENVCVCSSDSWYGFCFSTVRVVMF